MPYAHLHRVWRSAAPRRAQLRTYSSTGGSSGSAAPSRHALFYSDLVPGMIPVALLGSAVYLGLRLLQASLAHEKYLEAANARVKQLEEEVEALSQARVSKQVVAKPAQSAGKSFSWKLW